MDYSFNENEQKKYHHTQPRKPFSKEEDEILIKLYNESNGKKWKYIATQLEGRSPRQCRDRYNHYLCPDMRNDQWTVEEEFKLTELVKIHGTKWSVISTMLEGRSPNNLKNRWYKHIIRERKRPRKDFKPSPQLEIKKMVEKIPPIKNRICNETLCTIFSIFQDDATPEYQWC